MWVFDGETWSEEDGGARNSEENRQHPSLHEIATPELMVVEVPLTPREPIRRPARNRERSH